MTSMSISFLEMQLGRGDPYISNLSIVNTSEFISLKNKKAGARARKKESERERMCIKERKRAGVRESVSLLIEQKRSKQKHVNYERTKEFKQYV